MLMQIKMTLFVEQAYSFNLGIDFVCCFLVYFWIKRFKSFLFVKILKFGNPVLVFFGNYNLVVFFIILKTLSYINFLRYGRQ